MAQTVCVWFQSVEPADWQAETDQYFWKPISSACSLKVLLDMLIPYFLMRPWQDPVTLQPRESFPYFLGWLLSCTVAHVAPFYHSRGSQELHHIRLLSLQHIKNVKSCREEGVLLHQTLPLTPAFPFSGPSCFNKSSAVPLELREILTTKTRSTSRELLQLLRPS